MKQLTSGALLAALICTLTVLVEPAAASIQVGKHVECKKPLRPLLFNTAVANQRNPVLLVGGTAAIEIIYVPLEGRLMTDNYNTYYFELHLGGLIDINTNSERLNDCVKEVLKDAGKTKLHLIGHSQGGIVARTFIHDYQGENVVESMISLAVPHTGTTPQGLAALIAGLLTVGPTTCPKLSNGQYQPSSFCAQLFTGSALLARINQRPDDDPIHYTNISTTNDQWVAPWQRGQMRKPGESTLPPPLGPRMPCPNTSNPALCGNVVLQDACRGRRLGVELVDHAALANDAAVYSGIRNALEHREPTLNCAAL